MSRGLGNLQRRIMEVFEKKPECYAHWRQIGGYIYGPRFISRSEYESLRRAIRNLERRGLISKLWWHPDAGLYMLAEAESEWFERFCEIIDRRVSVGRAENPTDSGPLSVGNPSVPIEVMNDHRIAAEHEALVHALSAFS